MRNEGKLNTCCWHPCPTFEATTCWEPYCRDTGLQDGDACVQLDTATNIHAHGLHIGSATTEGASDACTFADTDAANPDLPWDNVFIAIPASGEADQASCSGTMGGCSIGNAQRFMFPIGPRSETSAFQPSPVVYPQWFGLQWYHPHLHEASRDQLGRGMAGALVVRNPVEQDIPVLAAIPLASERVIVLQRVPMDSSEIIQSSFVRLVNGRVRPRFTIKAGETQRWRLLNAGPDVPIHLSVHRASDASQLLPLYPIGFDGVPTPDIRPALASYWLHAGSRLEALVTAPTDASVGDRYELTWCETDVAAGSGEPTDSLEPDAACTGTTLVGATLEVVEGAATPVSFGAGDPIANLADFGLVPDLWSETNVTRRTIRFTQVVDPVSSAQFYIDVGDGNGDRQFHAEHVCHTPVTSTLGDVEEWTIENWTTDIHSIHIHVNPFQVDPASLSPALGSTPIYQDTAWVPLGTASRNPLDMGAVVTPGVLRLRIRATDYVGASVFHCHVLDHEDHGMMAAIRIEAR